MACRARPEVGPPAQNGAAGDVDPARIPATAGLGVTRTVQSIPKIQVVQPIGGARLLVSFQNGEQRTYDCGPLLSRPEFHLLADPAFFRAVSVDAGGYGISWNDDIDLSEYELWMNGVPIANNGIRADTPPSPP